jgi:hypothetical protein
LGGIEKSVIQVVMMKGSSAMIKGAFLPGLILGLYAPLLLTRDPGGYLIHLLWSLPAGAAGASALLIILSKPALVKGSHGNPSWVLRPLLLLSLALSVFIFRIPAIPYFLGAVVLGIIYHRVLAFLDEYRVFSAENLERAGLLIPFTASFFLFFQVNIIHDAYQYLCTLVSVAMDFDLNFYKEYYLMNANRFYNPFAAHSVRYLGVPILEAPFFAAGHLLAVVMDMFGHHHPANGMSYPYLLMTSLASSFFGLGALILLYRLCREFFPRGISLMATLGYWLASPLIFFTFLWNGWPHPFNVFFISLFLLYWQRTRGRKKNRDWIALGAMGGMLLLLRPTNGILALFPLAELLQNRREIKEGVMAGLAGPFLGGLTALALFSPQLAAWKLTSGSFWGGPYREIGDYFDWLDPAFFGTLFSASQHGLFSWSPLLLPASLGLFLLIGRNRFFGWLSVITVILHTYIFSSWSVWWTGIGFSNRFFTELSPFFVLGLAGLLEKAWSKGLFSREALTGLLSLFAVWNLFLIGEYRTGIIPYGIPDPGRVVDEPLTLAGIVYRHLFVFPDKFGTFFSAQWSNDSFFPNRLGHALTFKQPLAAAVVILVFVLVSWLFWRLARAIFQSRVGGGTGGGSGWILGGAALMAILTHVVVLGAHMNTLPFGYHYHFDSLDIPVRGQSEDVHLYSSYPRPVTNIDLLTHLVYGHTLEEGTPVAMVSVYDQADRRFDYLLRAGEETAENSYLRPEYIKDIKHTLDGVTIIREAMTSAYSSHIYPAITTLASLPLPEPLVVKKIRFRYLSRIGELVVSDVFMRDF